VALAIPASIHLRVGAPPPLVAMPGVIGMAEGDARATLEAAGFRVTEVLYETTAFGLSEGVVGQDPAPGDSVPPGSSVRLRVTNPTGVSSGERGVTQGILNETERARG